MYHIFAGHCRIDLPRPTPQRQHQKWVLGQTDWEWSLPEASRAYCHLDQASGPLPCLLIPWDTEGLPLCLSNMSIQAWTLPATLLYVVAHKAHIWVNYMCLHYLSEQLEDYREQFQFSVSFICPVQALWIMSLSDLYMWIHFLLGWTMFRYILWLNFLSIHINIEE